MKVVKFGGTSLASAAQIKKAVEIIQADEKRQAVVLSAPGKRDGQDIKITDLLINTHKLKTAGEDYLPTFTKIRTRFIELSELLEVNVNIETELDAIQQKIEAGTTLDFVESRGEYLNSLIISEVLGAEFVDAADVVRLTADGRVDPQSYELINKRLANATGRFVVPGFFGTGPDGEIKSFSRGGSDITGAIVARGVNADVYENWTDVSGILQADPRIVAEAQPIPEITYTEVRELASCGASVFHEEAIAPVRDAGIPINIKNTNRPTDSGTMIQSSRSTSKMPVVGISGKKPYRILNAEKFMLNRYPELPGQIKEVLTQQDLAVEFDMKGFDTFALMVDSSSNFDEEAICQSIIEKTDVDNCSFGITVALVGIVGAGLQSQTGLLGRMINALAQAGIEVRSISYGGSQFTALLTINLENYEKALKVLVGQLQN
ncbi:MAG: aspartate kinase [Desulfuromusa sp.]|nr:aspartate kinase [Desulfuromusa sp.]